MVKLSPRYPTIRQIDKQLWEVVEPVEAVTSFGKVIVGVGVKTDGASVPRALWSLFPPMSDYTNAAVVHDHMYKTHLVPRENGLAVGKTDRHIADLIFLELMEHLGTERWRRRAMFRAVRMFGWKPWKSKK